MNLYIFAIGGSGSRVLRSLTMLLASGIETNNNIIPIIIDPDTSNGDLDRTVTAMRMYETVRNELKFDDCYKNKFFSANVTALNNDGNYLLPLVGTSGINFDKYLGLGAMSQENQALTKMLFSNSNLSSTMDVGFKGNPNIGSIVLNQFTQSKDFKNFEANFVAGDKVFIISSIFGGTGASGFPLILKTLRTSSNTALASAPIGAVSLLPFFNLKTDNQSSIQADSFITKTKAALNYYEKNVTGNDTLNDMYYLGDDFSSHGYDNCEGGTNQANDAHFIELLAALSVLDFDKKSFTSPRGNTNFHEFGLKNQITDTIILSDLGSKTYEIIARPLTMMAILNSYLNNRTNAHRASQKWAKDRNSILGDSLYRSNFFANYLSFKSMFEEWLNELEDNKVGFAPFNHDGDIGKDGLAKVKAITPNYPGINPFRKKGYDLLDENLGKKLGAVPANSSAPVTFMEVFCETLSEICSVNLNIQ